MDEIEKPCKVPCGLIVCNDCPFGKLGDEPPEESYSDMLLRQQETMAAPYWNEILERLPTWETWCLEC